MMKKMLSLLLAFVMTAGLIPMSALAAGPADYGEELATVSGKGEYRDTTAEPGKRYEYTIVDSKGNVRKAELAGKPAAPTGNGITEQTGSGEPYYQKVTAPLNAENGIYLLVHETGTSEKAVTHEPGLKSVRGDGQTINGAHPDAEWEVTRDRQKFSFEADGKYLNISTHSVVSVSMSQSKQKLKAEAKDNGFTLSREGKSETYYITASNNGLDVTTEKNEATAFTLYKKVTEAGSTTYTVNTAGLDALLAQSFHQSEYTSASWQAYADARAAAEAAKNDLRNPYAERPAAEAALESIDIATRTLDSAIKGLEKKPVQPVDPDQPVNPGVCVKPDITWHRTKESKYGTEQPVQRVQYIQQGDWQNIAWNWDNVKGLKATDPDPWNAQNGHAATWQKGYEDGSWTDASVRRFTGTFTWPEGVGMDATATIQSVNDADYQFIYDYINADPDLKARYGNAKVLPINDDMYVFISKVDDGEPSSWSQKQAKKHLMFWTGTSGKGRWSQHGSTGDDWGRTEPARFEGKSATPAFHGSWPNLIDTITDPRANVNANVQNWDLNGQPNPMTQTDSWYTLTDTGAMMSTLNELYGPTEDLSGQQMRIDIYAFDNSADGGMDELELVLCTPEATTAQVKVQYWLDRKDAVDLGSTVMTRNIGEAINLPNGTNTNELNHKKAEAIRRAGESANVSDGVQIETDFVVKPSGNVINVVYTRDLKDIQFYHYDFGVTNEYLYQDTSREEIKNVSAECDTDDVIGVSHSGHDIHLTYTPRDALGNAISVTLVVERDSHTNRYPVMIVPASNVLYEENMMKPDPSISGAAWIQTSHKNVTVGDNETTVFGYAEPYQTSTGANGQWKATLTPTGTDKFSQDLNFSFTGQALDIIGSCGPNTGTLGITISRTDGTRVKNYLVDTSFTRGSIEQVPLVHAVLPKGDTYYVSISGANMGSSSRSTMSTMSAMGAASAAGADAADVYDLFERMGLTEDEIDEVEYIGMEDVLSQSVSTFAAAPAAAQNGNQTVALDGFRVYRSSRESGLAYPTNEQNVVYTNVMADGIQGSITAFIDNEEGSYDVTEYEKLGGPENEIYLAPGQAIVFQLADPGVKTAHISARAVEGPTTLTDAAGTEYSLTHNTELYYDVAVQNGMVAVGNNGTGLLALGNLKAGCGITAVRDQQMAVQMVMTMFAAPVPQPAPEFEIRFALNDDDLAWADHTPWNEVKSVTVSENTDGAAAPAIVLDEDEVLVHWAAEEIPVTLLETDVLTAAYLEENFDWTDTERVVTFHPVVEEVEAEEKFEPEHFDIQLTVERGYSAKYVSVNVEASDDVAYITVDGKRLDAVNADWVEFGFDPYYIFVTDLEYGRNEEAAVEIVAYNEDGEASEVFLARE